MNERAVRLAAYRKEARTSEIECLAYGQRFTSVQQQDAQSPRK